MAELDHERLAQFLVAAWWRLRLQLEELRLAPDRLVVVPATDVD
jgi:hypothetical protein